MKTVAGFRRTRYRGLDRTGLAGYLVAAAYNVSAPSPKVWHDLTMGYQPGIGQDRVEVTAEANRPVPTKRPHDALKFSNFRSEQGLEPYFSTTC